MINWTSFTPIHALTGGVIIGISVSLLLLSQGKIAGISGILGELMTPKKNEVAWRLAFLIGLMISPLLYSVFHPLPIPMINTGNLTLIISGLLVGVGTRLGSGCTSGHGICGIARLSRRSIIATGVFMLSGMITVYIHQLLSH